MTKKKIIALIVALWGFAVVTSFLVTMNNRPICIPSLAACTVTNVPPVAYLALLLPEVSTFMLILFVSLYLQYKIRKSNRFIHGIQKNALDREKAVRVGRLVEVLREQVKPMLSVLITGGIDGLFDLLLITVILILALGSPTTQFFVSEIADVSLLYCQLLSHLLCFGLFNKEIQEKILTCYPKQSQVVVLNSRP